MVSRRIPNFLEAANNPNHIRMLISVGTTIEEIDTFTEQLKTCSAQLKAKGISSQYLTDAFQELSNARKHILSSRAMSTLSQTAQLARTLGKDYEEDLTYQLSKKRH